MPVQSLISVSVVSHNQAEIVQHLLQDLQAYCSHRIEVILTVNSEERLPFQNKNFDYDLHYIFNKKQKGFGANHNTAFQRATGDFFCILNPDIRLNADPFDALTECLHDQMARVGVVAPRIINTAGDVENSARRFPTPFSLIKKIIGSRSKLEYIIENKLLKADWVAGMFMLFSYDTYKEIGGFNEKYFLYYEDIDLCARLKLKRYEVLLCPVVTAIHDARRKSHHNIKYFKWHVASIMRYFFSSIFFDVVVKKYIKK